MFRTSETVSISRSPEDVLEFVADLRNFPRWRANLKSSVVVSESYTDVGARCDERIRMGPRTIPASCEITALSAGRSLSFRALSHGLRYDGKAVVEPEPGGCMFTLSGEVRLSGLLRLLQPVIRARMQDGVRREAAAVKCGVEGLPSGSHRDRLRDDRPDRLPGARRPRGGRERGQPPSA